MIKKDILSYALSPYLTLIIDFNFPIAKSRSVKTLKTFFLRVSKLVNNEVNFNFRKLNVGF